MLRPVAPFVEYAINYDYISKVLCINKDKPALQCNGKCQLMKKLEKQQDDDFKSLRIASEDYPIGFVELLSVKRAKTILNTFLNYILISKTILIYSLSWYFILLRFKFYIQFIKKFNTR